MQKQVTGLAMKTNPYVSANYLSKCTYWWLLEIFHLGKNSSLRADDIYEVLPENVSEALGDQLEKLWEDELVEARLKSRKPRLWKVIRQMFGRSIVKQGFGTLAINVCKIVQLVIMTRLISYFAPLATTTETEAYVNASAFMLVSVLFSVVNRRVLHSQFMLGLRVKVACSSLVYRKMLQLSCTSSTANGLVVNIISNDFEKFDKLFAFLPYAWLTPLTMIVTTYCIWLEVGVAAFAGMSCMLIQMLPTQVVFYKMISKLRKKSTAKTDRRVLLIGEIINGMRAIKMYAWEKSFERLIDHVREQEINAIFMGFRTRAINFAMAMFTDRSASLCTICLYVLLGNKVTADRIFSTIGYFLHLRLIALKFYPDAVFYKSAINVVLERTEVSLLYANRSCFRYDSRSNDFQGFLLGDQIESVSSNKRSLDNSAVIVRNVSAAWTGNSSINHLDHLDLRIASQEMYAVVGPVGSGKSSLLKLILGELRAKSGEISVHGKVSYASQEPWLFTGSVRDNVLFGEGYNEERYKKVIEVCQLAKDIRQLPYEDETLVGERGAFLSGGQCARINLARAVYRDVDVYLLDDPLSAVDSHVSNDLLKHCVNGFLKDKTRILVTHQMRYLKDADKIITLNKGQIEFQGDYQTFVTTKEYLDYLSSNSANDETVRDEGANDYVGTPMTATKEARDKTSEPEEPGELTVQGRMKVSLIVKYFKAGGSSLTLLLIMLLCLASQLAASAFDYWLSYWTNREEQQREWNATTINATNATLAASRCLSHETALYTSVGLIATIVVLSISKNLLFFKRCLNSSRNIHNVMFSRLLRAPARFFNANPSGRTLNRFSKDTGTVDDEMPVAMIDVIERSLIIACVLVQIVVINWWTIGPIVIVGYVIVRTSDVYFSTTQILKRLEGNAKSPVFSLVNSTLLGLATIRSCCAQQIVRKEFDARQDANSAVQYLCLATAAAYTIGLDLLVCSVLGFMVYTFIPLKGVDIMGADVGLALTQFLTVCTTIQYLMRQFADLICHMTSVERMFQYTELEQEGSCETKLLHQNWPSRGEIVFENLSLKYSVNERVVLQNLNFTIAPNMKIGIVGRTGAGKSSLITALFRLVEPDGTIYIDNVDTKQIGLFDLRSRISIIPQEPTLFTRSLRDNLDPFDRYDDHSLWSALQQVEMNQAFESLEQSIDNNLSAGQRQLLCLARAIVEQNKILILDEATANIDHVTDELIQKTIRTRFKDCTVLTIAHRLNTIVHSDAIIVMESGKVVEFDQPYVLLQNERGYLREIVRKSGSASRLLQIAKKAYDERSSREFND